MYWLPGYLYQGDWQKLENETDWTQASDTLGIILAITMSTLVLASLTFNDFIYGTNLKTILNTNGDIRNHISEHRRLWTYYKMDWSSVECVSTNYQQWLVLESWYTNLEQEPLNRCQSYLHLTNDSYMTSRNRFASSRAIRTFLVLMFVPYVWTSLDSSLLKQSIVVYVKWNLC